MDKTNQNIFYKKLGENIKHFREKRRIKQESVAQILDLTRISVSNVENGKQKIQLHSLLELAAYFDTAITDLVPSLDLLSRNIPAALEKGIANAEKIDSKSVEKVKDFIKLTESSTSQYAKKRPTKDS